MNDDTDEKKLLLFEVRKPYKVNRQEVGYMRGTVHIARGRPRPGYFSDGGLFVDSYCGVASLHNCETLDEHRGAISEGTISEVTCKNCPKFKAIRDQWKRDGLI